MLATPDREQARSEVVVGARLDEECRVAAPSAISARGWRGALRRTFLRVFEARLLTWCHDMPFGRVKCGRVARAQ